MKRYKNILVTGASGFIGSNFIKVVFDNNEFSKSVENIINLDKLTYAGNSENNKEYSANPKYNFIKGDIASEEIVYKILTQYQIDLVVNFAAESHVDNSINDPSEFIKTNIFGVYNLLSCSKKYEDLGNQITLLHVSTDEVYGSLKIDEDNFDEATSYKPNSPYSASKAASDHLVRAWNKTYGLKTFITNCSNNYGPMQHNEKLIPKVISNAVNGINIPIYCQGDNIRDWLYVDDHCKAILSVLESGEYGETYNIGGLNEKTNIEIVTAICEILDELLPKSEPYKKLIHFIADRPGHDFRYSINAEKIMNKLDWHPEESFETGIRKTIHWYLKDIL